MNETASTPRRILLTGAAGGIGSALYRHTSGSYWFRLADRAGEVLAAMVRSGHEAITLDIADLDACREASRNIDTVIHLAADPSPRADFYASLLENNIKGTYNVFRAARDEGCRRVIYASSVQVVAGYPVDVQAQDTSPVRPMNMYGVSKCFGEAVAAYFARAEGLSSIVVRIGAYDVAGDNANWLRRTPNPLSLSAYVSERDLNQLLQRCVEVAGLPFAIVHGISDNRFKRVDISASRDLLGYVPQDDAFAIFGADLQDWLQR
jgi:NAD+ dependent glucose-6-phosphate dehydrogenase